MRNKRFHLLVPAMAAALVIAGCGKSDKPPEGQVVATVDGTEVTIHELKAEIDRLPNRGGKAPRELVEAVALASVIERKMLTAEAAKRDLDKNPQYLLAKTRTDEVLLVQALRADIQKNVKPVPRDLGQKFVADNPQLFGDRKILTLDQIQFLRPANMDQLPIAEAKTMGEVEKILSDANVAYRRAPEQIDTLTVSPKLTAEILRLSAAADSEPFMFVDQPAGAPAPIVFINTVAATKTEPFIGEAAISYAQRLLERENVQKALMTQLKEYQAAYKDKIVYAKGYGPPALPQSGAAPAAAPAAPAAAN
jgi:EpsD family peptidyl-prolyl cis-trans isomerase